MDSTVKAVEVIIETAPTEVSIDIPYIDEESFVISDENVAKFINETFTQLDLDNFGVLDLSTFVDSNSGVGDTGHENPINLEDPQKVNTSENDSEGNRNRIVVPVNFSNAPTVCISENEDSTDPTTNVTPPNICVGRASDNRKGVIDLTFCRCSIGTWISGLSIISGLIIGLSLASGEWRRHIGHM